MARIFTPSFNEYLSALYMPALVLAMSMHSKQDKKNPWAHRIYILVEDIEKRKMVTNVGRPSTYWVWGK
jgi:hypothetical protein